MRDLGAELERREHKRFRRRISCVLHVGRRSFPGTIEDLSEGGVRVRSVAEIGRGARLRLDFSDLRAEAQVMYRCAPPLALRGVEPAGLGLRFLPPDLH